MSVLKGILYGEAVRLRRLNEVDERYLQSVEKLSEKCVKSGFPTQLVNKAIANVKTWKNRFHPDNFNTNSIKKDFNYVIWASPLKQLIKLNKIEKSLSPFSTIVYKRPPTLSSILCNYKQLSHTQVDQNIVGCHPCEHCSLCGCRSLKDGHQPVCAVTSSKQIVSTFNKSKFPIYQSISCQDFGIYVVTCRICGQQYVGQTITTFAKRWAQHRAVWKQPGNNNNNDRASLRLHYTNNHNDKINKDINTNYTITFIQTTDTPTNLDFLESRWIARLNAQININSTVLNLY